jgi:hypothetical protein
MAIALALHHGIFIIVRLLDKVLLPGAGKYGASKIIKGKNPRGKATP